MWTSTAVVCLLLRLSAPRDYKLSGADWTEPMCVPKNNPRLSPIVIDPSDVECDSSILVDFHFYQTDGLEFVVSYTGDPQTIWLTPTATTLYTSVLLKTPRDEIVEYNFTGVVFRTPAEHRYGDKVDPLEGQLHFQLDSRFAGATSATKIIASAAYFNTTAMGSSLIFKSLVGTLNKTAVSDLRDTQSGSTVKVVIASANQRFPQFAKPVQFLHYSGTDTSGDCDEEVLWLLLDQRVPCNFYDLRAFVGFLEQLTEAGTNSRQVHNINRVRVFRGGTACDNNFAGYVCFLLVYVALLYFVAFREREK